jgi:hypothetical protein
VTIESRHSVFVSYARRDRPKVSKVVEGLRFLGADVWLDESLAGGQAWWDSVLDQVRDCDLFVQSVSPATLESDACESERAYAVALGKPILPVLVEPMSLDLLPEALAGIQVVEYTEPTPEAAFRLARAVRSCEPAAAPPPEVPPRPPVPLSYLGSLGERIRAHELSLDEQHALVARLRAAMERGDEHEAAVDLLRRLQRREDLYHAVARAIESALTTNSATHLDLSGAASTTEPERPDSAVEASLAAPEEAADASDREAGHATARAVAPAAASAELIAREDRRLALRVVLPHQSHILEINIGVLSADWVTLDGSTIHRSGDIEAHGPIAFELTNGEEVVRAVGTVRTNWSGQRLKEVVVAVDGETIYAG